MQIFNSNLWFTATLVTQEILLQNCFVNYDVNAHH